MINHHHSNHLTVAFAISLYHELEGSFSSFTLLSSLFFKQFMIYLLTRIPDYIAPSI